MLPSDRSWAAATPDGNTLGDTVELRDVLRKLWARKRLVFVCTALGAGLAFAAAKQITPIYSGSAYVLINPRPVGRAGAAAEMPAGPDVVQTQALVLQSRDLAAETVARLDLERDPEFNPKLRRPNRLLAVFRPVLTWLDLVPGVAPQLVPGTTEVSSGTGNPASLTASAGPSTTLPPTGVVDEFLKRLHVTAQDQSQIIRVSFSSSRPATAALVPNTLLRLYLEDQVTEKEADVAREAQSLGKTVAELQQKMLASTSALAGYRQKVGLVGRNSSRDLGQELSQIRAQLAIVEARKAEAAARLGDVQALLSPARNQSAVRLGSASTAATTESPVLERLREREADLLAKLAADRRVMGAENPQSLQLEAQLSALRAGMRSEAARAEGRLKVELAAAQATEAALQRQESEFSREFSQASGSDPALVKLVDAADANRKTYETYLTRLNEARSEIGQARPDGRIVSAAAMPIKPSYPPTSTISLLGFAIGAGAGIVLAAVIDGLLRGLRSARQVEEVLGIRCLGLVPRIARRRWRQSFAAEIRDAIEDPAAARGRAAAFGQAMRTVQFKLVGGDRASGAQVVLVTAALPGEGKSWIAVSLATALATEGYRVALVDCDPHRPVIHRMFNGPRRPGLTDFFAGGAGIDAVVHLDVASGVEYVPIGADPSREAWYLTLARLRRLVGQLQGTHQFIILDSAPVLAVSETAMLSQLAQKTIFVVRWGRTSGQIARHALRQLFDSGNSEVAAVLSMVDFRRAAKSGDVVADTYARLQNYYGAGLRDRPPTPPSARLPLTERWTGIKHQ